MLLKAKTWKKAPLMRVHSSVTLCSKKCTKCQPQTVLAAVTVIQEEKHLFKGDMRGINTEDPISLSLNYQLTQLHSPNWRNNGARISASIKRKVQKKKIKED